jgi:hypothetical protein
MLAIGVGGGVSCPKISSGDLMNVVRAAIGDATDTELCRCAWNADDISGLGNDVYGRIGRMGKPLLSGKCGLYMDGVSGLGKKADGVTGLQYGVREVSARASTDPKIEGRPRGLVICAGVLDIRLATDSGS